MYVIIKYLIINQHDDSYITLDKLRHLLVNHYVKDDVQSFNVVLCIKMQDYFHYNKSCFLNKNKNDNYFFNYIYNYLIITITK